VRLRSAGRTHAIDDLVNGTALAAGDSEQTGASAHPLRFGDDLVNGTALAAGDAEKTGG
jgi:hypothetical protein